MANNQNLSPFPWTPSTTPKEIIGGRVDSGDWVQVSLSYRTTNTTPVVFAPGHFLVHVLYTPDSDDTTAHPDQPTRYGGSASNRSSVYRINPGVAFQVPWKGQLSVVAGGNSAAATCVLDVVMGRGHTPRDFTRARYGEFGQIATYAPRIYAPPVVGLPQRYPSTWIQVPNVGTIAFPDGASGIMAVDDTGIPANPIPLTIASLGNALRLNLASGIPNELGALAQGGACTNGTPATWTNAAAGTLNSVTIWSSLGN